MSASDLPSVGRPISLGEAQDAEDAAALLQVMRAVASVRERYTAGAGRVAREAVWQLWEGPRLPPPIVGPRYPAPYPWSPAARHRYTSIGGKAPAGGWGLIIEHVVPKNLLLSELYQQADALDVPGLVALLQTGLAAAVITTDEDKLLGSKLATRMPESSEPDVWARYSASGFDVFQFAPLIVT